MNDIFTSPQADTSRADPPPKPTFLKSMVGFFLSFAAVFLIVAVVGNLLRVFIIPYNEIGPTYTAAHVAGQEGCADMKPERPLVVAGAGFEPSQDLRFRIGPLKANKT